MIKCPFHGRKRLQHDAVHCGWWFLVQWRCQVRRRFPRMYLLPSTPRNSYFYCGSIDPPQMERHFGARIAGALRNDRDRDGLVQSTSWMSASREYGKNVLCEPPAWLICDASMQGFVGQPLPGVEARLVDNYEKVVQEDDIEGEIRVKGPAVFQGYLVFHMTSLVFSSSCSALLGHWIDASLTRDCFGNDFKR